MCGRYTLTTEATQLQARFQFDTPLSDYAPSYHMAPGQDVLAVIRDAAVNRAGLLRWGLVPSWLDRSVTEPDALQPLLEPAQADRLEAYEVSSQVNSARYNAPACMLPAQTNPSQNI